MMASTLQQANAASSTSMHLEPPWKPPQTDARCLISQMSTSARSIAAAGHSLGPVCAACNAQRVTLGLLYYSDPALLREQLAIWSQWAQPVQELFELLVVDDGSPAAVSAVGVLAEARFTTHAAIRVLGVLPPKLQWNIGGARNLIMHLASSCWVILCDLDYALPSALAAAAAAATRLAGEGTVFKFTRKSKMKPFHPAIALIRRDLYWEAGGCDEDFVGNYGMTDPHFWYRLNMRNPPPTVVRNTSWPKLVTVSADERCKQQKMCRSRESLKATLKAHTLERNNTANILLFKDKKSGRMPWSNEYLRFRWTETTFS